MPNNCPFREFSYEADLYLCSLCMPVVTFTQRGRLDMLCLISARVVSSALSALAISPHLGTVVKYDDIRKSGFDFVLSVHALKRLLET